MTFWRRGNLRSRILLIVTALMLSTLAGGAIMIWYSYQMDALFVEMVEKDVRILGVAEELEAELAKRKGYLSYFFIDGDEAGVLETRRFLKEKPEADFATQSGAPKFSKARSAICARTHATTPYAIPTRMTLRLFNSANRLKSPLTPCWNGCTDYKQSSARKG